MRTQAPGEEEFRVAPWRSETAVTVSELKCSEQAL